MKIRKLKSWVVPALYVVSISIIFASVILVGKIMATSYEKASGIDKNIPTNIIDDTTTTPVVEITNETVNHPYLLEGVGIAKDFYNKDDDEEKQINSLIFYKNTYMENTGVLYNAPEEFEVVSVLDGTVTSITEDEILGNVVEVTHTTELITIYHCLGKVDVKVGDTVKQNDVLGTSGKVGVDKGYDNALLFEVNFKGQILNPNDFYNMKISDLMK